MNGTLWTRKRLALMAAAAISLSATAYLSVAAVYSRPVVSLLGPDWECRRIAFVTSCTRHGRIEPVADRAHKSIALGKRV